MEIPDDRLRSIPRKRRAVSPIQFCMLFYGAIAAMHVAVHFPYNTDPQTARVAQDQSALDFYKQAYAPSKALSKEQQEREQVYVRVAQEAAEAANIKGLVRRFVDEYGLRDKRILDIGAGRGYLQDLVENYTGLDISPTAQRYFHKPFVLASATAMPFKDHEFDAVWTIWVLEHVPNPESALREMRRVVKPGGLILLAPAWFCTSWAAGGYEVRPYSDFGLHGKLVKASLPIRRSPIFQMSYVIPSRAIRYVGSKFGSAPTSFHYRRLAPNFEKYWLPDSDAVNSMDPYEAVLWFESRGDHCLNCPGGLRNLTGTPSWLVIKTQTS